jgi:hypothetical protein
VVHRRISGERLSRQHGPLFRRDQGAGPRGRRDAGPRGRVGSAERAVPMFALSMGGPYAPRSAGSRATGLLLCEVACPGWSPPRDASRRCRRCVSLSRRVLTAFRRFRRIGRTSA